MGQRRKPELWFTPSFRCYSFESSCHGWRFFSLHRRPNPPFEWSPCFLRTVQLLLAASPCSRLSRPQSTIGQSDFRPVIRSSLPCRLVGPYKLGLNPTDLPCSHGILWLHAGGTNPGSISEHLHTASRVSAFPVGDKVGYFHHDRFRGYLAVHCCSGRNLPVYAS